MTRPFAIRGSPDSPLWRLVVVLDGGESRVHPEVVRQTAALLLPLRATVTNRRPEWMAPATFVEVRVGELGWRPGTAGTTAATSRTLAGDGSPQIPLVCFAALANAFTMAHEVYHVFLARHTQRDWDLMAGPGFTRGYRLDRDNHRTAWDAADAFANRWFLPSHRGGAGLPGFPDPARLAGWEVEYVIPKPETIWSTAKFVAAGQAGDACGACCGWERSDGRRW